MHRQTELTEIPMSVKRRVWERDDHCCILCGRNYTASPNAHFIPRSKGGLGVEQNIVTLCLKCHDRFDNTPTRIEHMAIEDRIRGYLKWKYPNWDEATLTYKKGM